MSIRPNLKALGVVLAVPVLLFGWIGFQLATTGHTGILRGLREAKHFLSAASLSSWMQERSPSKPAGPQHSVSLTWKPSDSPVVGYNVYRRNALGVTKLNSEPVKGTTYVDRTVESGQTYFYVTKAVTAKGAESSPSNEVRADVPSP